MGKTFHSKQEFKKLVKELGISAAKAQASRHPDGTRAKGLRQMAQDKIHIYILHGVNEPGQGNGVFPECP